MTDNNPQEPHNPNDLLDELHAIGENLRGLFTSAWDSPERQRLQQDLEKGLNDLTTNLNQAATDFRNSQTGQQLKEDVADFNERLRTGEVEKAVRSEVLGALRMANEGLKKAAESLKTPPSSSG